jgi:hypothetical protein
MRPTALLRVLTTGLLVLLTACTGVTAPEQQPAAPADRVMVTLEPAPPAIWESITGDLEQTYSLRRVVAWTLSTLGEQCIVFDLPRGHSPQEIVRRLQADPRIVIAQPLQHFATLGSFHASTAILQHSALTLHLEQAHHWATGRGVRIAVIDTGIDVEHPDLKGRIVQASNFVTAGRTFNDDIHGTAVAGIIAAHANPEVGIVGVAPNAEIFALKACWQEPPGSREAVCDSYTLALAIDYAIAHGAQILNLSLGGPEDPLLAHLLEGALHRGIVVIAATAPNASLSFPASLPGVIAVAGSDDLRGGSVPSGHRLPRATLAAPAIDILSTVPHGHYDFFSGSSLAAAQVSGIAALLLEREPRLTPAEMSELFYKTARPIASAAREPYAQVEQVDACAALALALNTGPCR